jgi:DNA-directed RNA polymerase specialized sigma subunit
MEKQFYILVKGEKIPVDEATYRAYKRPVWTEKKRRQRETAGGTIPLSFDALLSDSFDMPDGTDIEAIVHDKMVLDALLGALRELSFEEQDLIRDIFYLGRTERQVAAKLNLSQKAVNKRKRKALGKLSENEVLRNLYRNP